MGHHYCDRAVNFTDPDHHTVDLLSRYLAKYRGLVACGLPGGGKTEFLDLIMRRRERRTIWRRGDLFRAMFGDFIDFSMMPTVYEFEKRAFDKLLTEHDHPVCFEGWLTTSRGRADVRRLFGSWPVALLVFDGPVEILTGRVMRSATPPWPTAEVPFQMEILSKSFQRPTVREGWAEVIYVNTCGEAGEEHLRDLLNL